MSDGEVDVAKSDRETVPQTWYSNSEGAIAKYTPCVFSAPAEGSPLHFGIDAGVDIHGYICNITTACLCVFSFRCFSCMGVVA